MKPIEVTLPCSVKMRVSEGMPDMLSVELNRRAGMRIRDDGTVFMSISAKNLPVFRDIIDTIIGEDAAPTPPTFSQRVKFLFTGKI